MFRLIKKDTFIWHLIINFCPQTLTPNMHGPVQLKKSAVIRASKTIRIVYLQKYLQ